MFNWPSWLHSGQVVVISNVFHIINSVPTFGQLFFGVIFRVCTQYYILHTEIVVLKTKRNNRSREIS